jgi:hypothetical protein
MRMYTLFLLVLCAVLPAQSDEVTLEQNPDWNGWEAIIVGNGLISTATVPAIGARVMQYDLGDHPSVFRDPALNGKTYTPNPAMWYNFGGFKNWPSPQYGAGRWSWPPPPVLDYAAYTSEIVVNSADSVVIRVTSPIEQYKTPQLQFVREMTLYKETSRVKMRQILLNHDMDIQDWGIWDITQSIVNHQGESDFENYWTYFSINPESVFGSDGVNTQVNSPAWTGEVADGIYGTQFKPNAQKLFADTDQGWICHVDERDGVAFVKTFPVFPGKHYPDDEARIAVYMGANYEEVEVMGPVEEITANGGQIEFIINWWATRVKGPILSVNSTCAVNRFLQLSDNVLSGNYGVFYTGQVKTVCLDAAGLVIYQGQENPVTPLENFDYNETIDIPVNTARIELHLYSEAGAMIGIVDGNDMGPLTAIHAQHTIQIDDCCLYQNYPNPFNTDMTIPFTIQTGSHAELVIFNMAGEKQQCVIDDYLQPGSYAVRVGADEWPSGLYYYELRTARQTLRKKCLLIK